MKIVKINCKQYFGVNKTVNVLVSVELMQKSTKFKTMMLEAQLDQAKAQLKLKSEAQDGDQTDSSDDKDTELSPEDQVAVIEKQLAEDNKETEQLNKTVGFIQEVMNYSEKQMKQITANNDEMTLVDGAVYIYYRIQGMTDKELNQSKEESAKK